jgi:hypothetical protein
MSAYILHLRVHRRAGHLCTTKCLEDQDNHASSSFIYIQQRNATDSPRAVNACDLPREPPRSSCMCVCMHVRACVHCYTTRSKVINQGITVTDECHPKARTLHRSACALKRTHPVSSPIIHLRSAAPPMHHQWSLSNINTLPPLPPLHPLTHTSSSMTLCFVHRPVSPSLSSSERAPPPAHHDERWRRWSTYITMCKAQWF